MSKSMPSSVFNTDTLIDEVALPVDMGNAPLPATVTLKSAAAGRKIELSTDGGSEYFTPTYDVTSATMLVLNIAATVTHVRFTGAANDVWRIQ